MSHRLSSLTAAMSATRAPALLLRSRWMLLTLLLLAPASSDSEHCGRERRPTITANKTSVFYKQDLILFCSANASNLTMHTRNGHQLHVEHLNSTTIQLIHNEPEGLYGYRCIDSNTGCSDILDVHVYPAMSVTGPRVYHSVDFYNSDVYFIPRDEVFNVSCTGMNAGSIELQWDRRGLRATTVNATTITATMAVYEYISDTTLGGTYRCISNNMGTSITVISDYYPDVKVFRCVYRFEGEYKRYIKCFWETSSKSNKFKLYLLHPISGATALVCADRFARLIRSCGAAVDDELHKYIFVDISLKLQICNEVFCVDEMFVMNYDNIAKLSPVFDIEVLPYSSWATVGWRHGIWFAETVFRVDYRLLGTDWVPVNTTAVRPSIYSDYVNNYALTVALPCPDAHYEIRVYIKVKSATEDIYWSEPTHAYFFTAPSKGEVAPACDKDFREVTEKPRPTASVVLYQVRELISDERKAKSALKKYISVLNEKKAKIKALMNTRT